MRGFTLVETIVTIFIFTLAMGAITGFVVYGYRTQSYAFNQGIAIREARKGIETMIREIREARTAEDGSYTLVATQDYEFSFYSDIDKDEEVEKVRYFLEDGKFKKGVIQPTRFSPEYPADEEEVTIISQYVVNQPPIFKYYDKNGKELPVPARKKDTKMIEIYLVINFNPHRPPQNFELRSRTQIRNLKKEF